MVSRRDTVSLGLFLITCLSVLSFLVFLGIQISRSTIPFDTDEADHANAALELYSWIQRGDIGGIGEAIRRQAFYPPVHSIPVAISYLLLEPSLFSSRLPALVFFAATLLLLAFFLRRFFQDVPDFVSWGAISFALIFSAASEIAVLHSTLSMLEMTGVFLVAALLIAAMKRGEIVLCCFALLIMLTKYSFGVIVFPALVCSVWYPTRRANARKPLFAAVLLSLSFGAWAIWTDTGSLIHFFIGHPSYDPIFSWENLTFEIRSWLSDYSLGTLSALLSIPLASLAAWHFWSRLPVRLASFLVLWAFLILGLSTTNESRHFMVALPSMWVLTTLGAVVSWQSQTRWLTVFRLISVALPILIVVRVPRFIASLPSRIQKEYEGRPEYSHLEEFVAESAGDGSPSLINGVSDALSLESFRWYFARRLHVPYTEVKLDAFPYREDKNQTAFLRKRNVARASLDESFPKDSVEDILRTAYYSSFVLVTSPRLMARRDLRQGELIDRLNSYPFEEQKIGEFTVRVYRLRTPA
jgi:hypothetical protein